MLPLTCGPVPRRAVEVTRRVVSSFGLAVAQPGRYVAVLRGEPCLAPANTAQLVGPGVFPILGRLGPVFGRDPAVVDRALAVLRGPGASRVGHGTVVGVLPALAHGAISRSSIQITRSVVARLGLPVTQPRCDIAILRRQASLAAAHTAQLVGAGIFTVLGRLRPILGRHLSVFDGLGSVVRRAGAPRWSRPTIAFGVPAVAGRPVLRIAVEMAGRVVAGRSLAVSKLGLPVTRVRGEVAVAPLDVALTRRRQCGLGFTRAVEVLISGRHCAAFIHVNRPWALPSAYKRFSVYPSP